MQSLKLPQSLQSALSPLFKTLPLNQALKQLVVTQPQSPDLTALVGKLIGDPAIALNPALQAALWLYVDELDRSHDICQNIKTPDGSYLHGIMHRREGDFSNSHYWFHHVGTDHPVYDQIDGYDAHAFIDEVKANPQDPRLVALQQAEWVALVNHCIR
jgi:hypothetical protein